ncbi:SCF E3 ubiquitin ligase complex F-box protein grrA [Coprinopsis cinerea okayama7|uniref:SCF E3 ubiquitin ligase complex F-box protein grrA n=1 Tax=Coprinopsis cinerea (strain Okayama-7 / 130 / ATCC MYA-4618 / FGSC 9003) TaxID=240176 RepID=A8NYM9_COPC7|nr:SCF E3 ubiquitin ligase complex F-box protein grrA [Coprinopsis cinerea okayama7\|eukprot:XP_001837471.2 SCF E3 ubiquitin ligase complex F-box protein grrA [Coprinopsis cinerea okayama7\
MLYRQFAPSTTSLSDEYDEDEPSQSNFFKADQPLFATDAAVHPHWSSSNQPGASSKRALKAPAKSPIMDLPPEILIAILKYLSSPRDLLNALKVSTTWCECAVELLWVRPTFPRYSTLQKMARLLKQSKSTFPYAKFIRRLNFMTLSSELRDETLAVFNRCSRLERLTLTGCKLITPTSLEQVLTCFPNLVAVDLSGVVETTTEVITAFAPVAKRLQGINLSNCSKVTDPALIALAENCPMLRRVKLSGVNLVTDAGVSAIVKKCPLLLEIDLHQCELITDVAVRDIWLYSTHMREMRLSQCTAITDLAFPALNSAVNPFPSNDPNVLPPLHVNRTFEQLRLLDLTACANITDDAVEGIIAHAPKIRNLVLAKCTALTDRSVEAICALGKHLHYLHLGHASRITDASVKTLARSCTRIRYIDFANCIKLTDMSVFELSALPKLRRIGLVRVTNLTDEAVYSLAERHATLERIHLSYCDQISVMAIHFLLLKLHKLTHLSLSGVPAFRNPDLQQFCREAPKDFNTTQRQNFCVFSGKGVSHLRAFLTQLFDTITEQNGTDDTEYEDEDVFPEPFQRAPEPETGDGDEDMVGPAYHVISPNVNTTRGTRFSRQEAISPRSYEVALQQRETQRRAHRTFADGFSAMFSAGGNIGVTTVHGAVSGPLDTNRITVELDPPDRLPVVEPVSPVSPPGNSAGITNTEPSATSASFFQGFQEPVFAPNQGARTPELHFAEIGHGRGASAQHVASPGSSRNHGSRSSARDRTPRQPHAAIAAAIHQSAHRGRSSNAHRPVSDPGSVSLDMNGEREGWSQQGNGVVLPGPSIRELEASVQSALNPSPSTARNGQRRQTDGSHRERQRGLRARAGRDGEEEQHHHHGGGGSSSRGRSVRRTIRNGLNAAENYASTFLFGRPWTEDGGSGPGQGSNGNHSVNQNNAGSSTTHATHWFGGR